MATSNFMTYDAGSIYAISSRDLFCEEENNVSDDVLNDDFSWYYEDVKDNIFNDLLKLDSGSISVYDGNTIERNVFNRNFDGEGVGIVESTKFYGDLEVTIAFNVVAMSGYYDGVNFDYLAKVHIDGSEICNFSEIEEYFDLSDFCSSMNKGMLKIQSKNAINWLLAVGTNLENEIERILKSNVAHELKVSARFSNGETMYQAV